MTFEQVCNAITANKVRCIQVKDMADNLLLELVAADCDSLVSDLEEQIKIYKGYQKVSVRGKLNEKSTWGSGFKWQVAFTGDATVAGVPASVNNGSIGAMDFIGMYSKMMDANFDLQRKLMEKTLESNNQDPSKWLPLIREGRAMLHGEGMAGPPGAATAAGKKLHFGDVGDTSKMTDDDIQNAIMTLMTKISTKIDAKDFLVMITLIEKNPDLRNNAPKINALLDAIIVKPALLDSAMSFI